MIEIYQSSSVIFLPAQSFSLTMARRPWAREREPGTGKMVNFVFSF